MPPRLPFACPGSALANSNGRSGAASWSIGLIGRSFGPSAAAVWSAASTGGSPVVMTGPRPDAGAVASERAPWAVGGTSGACFFQLPTGVVVGSIQAILVNRLAPAAVNSCVGAGRAKGPPSPSRPGSVDSLDTTTGVGRGKRFGFVGLLPPRGLVTDGKPNCRRALPEPCPAARPIRPTRPDRVRVRPDRPHVKGQRYFLMAAQAQSVSRRLRVRSPPAHASSASGSGRGADTPRRPGRRWRGSPVAD